MKLKIILIQRLEKEKQLVKNLYITAFDYIDKTLIVLLVASGGVSIVSFGNVIQACARIASASFTLVFSVIKNNKKWKEETW